MIQKLTALLLFFSCLTSAQVFNRAFTYTANEWCGATMVDDRTIYVSLSANLHYGPTYNMLHKMDAAGSLLAVDTFEIILRGYPAHLEANGFLQLTDSSFFLYGGYIDGCDADVKGGAFVIQYDQELNELNRTVFPDSTLADEYEIWKVDSNKYVLTGANSITLFDGNLNKLHYFKDSTIYTTGTVLLPGNTFLRTAETINGTDTAYYFDVNTYGTSTAPVFSDSIYDLGNNDFITAKGFNKIVRYSKSGLQKTDSVNLIAIAGFLPSQIDVQSEAIIVTDTQNFALLSKTTLALIAKGKVAKHGGYPEHSGDLFYRDSVLVVATNNRTGHVDLEAFEIGKPRSAPYDDLRLKVRQDAQYNFKFDTIPRPVKNVQVTIDWLVTIINDGSDTLRNMALNYNYFSSYMCSGDNFMISKANLSIAPGDSMSIPVDSVFHGEQFTGPDFVAWIKVSAVMANGLIVKSGGWKHSSVIFKNVSTPEPEVAQPIHVYPNPAGSYLKVQCGETFDGAVEIFNLGGQLLQSQKVNVQDHGDLSIPLHNLPSGVYILKATSNKVAFSKRFVKN